MMCKTFAGWSLTSAAIIVLVGFYGCAAPKMRPAEQQAILEQFEIGSTTGQDVEGKLGAPTGVEVATGDAQPHVSWGYGHARLGTNPLRFIPFFGAFGVAAVEDVESSSLALGFSGEEKLVGITQRKLGRYTVELARPGTNERVETYGERNLNAPAIPIGQATFY